MTPRLLCSRAAFNFVLIYGTPDAGGVLKVPQRLGTLFLDVPAECELEGIVEFSSLSAAKATITTRNWIAWPVWRLSILIRDLSRLIDGNAPPARKHP